MGRKEKLKDPMSGAKFEFRSEDLDTWIRAAIVLGEATASADPNRRTSAISFLEEQLTGANKHARRHAWCAAGAAISLSPGSVDAPARDAPEFPSAGFIEETSSLLKKVVEAAQDPARSKKIKLSSDEFWRIASFLAGATASGMERLGVPAEAWLPAVAKAANTRPEFFALISSTTWLIERSAAEGVDILPLLDELLRQIPSEHAMRSRGEIDWLRYVLRVQAIAARVSAGDLTPHLELGMDEALLEIYRSWRRSPDDESLSVAVIRAAQERFCDHLRWREELSRCTAAQRAYLHVFLHWRTSEPQDLQFFGLTHRIRILGQDIELWHGENERLLANLTRILKLLLHDEIEQKSGALSFDRTMGHFLAVRPLLDARIDDQNIPKDVATILSQLLTKVRQNSKTADYQELLYLILHTNPSNPRLANMEGFSANALVHRDIAGISTLSQDLDEALKQDVFIDAHSMDPEVQGRAIERLDALWKSYEKVTHQIWNTKKLPAVLRSIARRIGPGDAGSPAHIMEKAPNGRGTLLGTLLAHRGLREHLRDWTSASPHTLDQGPTRREVLERTKGPLQEFHAAVVRAAAHEQTITDESGEPQEIIGAMQGLLLELKNLEGLAWEFLPLLERKLVCSHLSAYHQEIEQRLQDLVSVVEGEDEGRAARLGRLQVIKGKAAPGPGSRDQRIYTRWMLKRYMLREVLPEGHRGVLRALTSFPVILGWLALPFILWVLGRRHDLSMDQVWTNPFVLITLANVGLLGVYAFQSRRFRPRSYRFHLLVPQMFGVLLLGIINIFQAWENLSLAINTQALTTLVYLLTFLLGGWMFVRYVLLDGQDPMAVRRAAVRGKDRKHQSLRKRLGQRVQPGPVTRRAFRLMALGLWQASTLVGIFTLIHGQALMAALSISDQAALGGGETSNALYTLVAPQISVGSSGGPGSAIFPWVNLIWTVQLFFFSAVIERVMNRNNN